jgi:hypothetical protein
MLWQQRHSRQVSVIMMRYRKPGGTPAGMEQHAIGAHNGARFAQLGMACRSSTWR